MNKRDRNQIERGLLVRKRVGWLKWLLPIIAILLLVFLIGQRNSGINFIGSDNLPQLEALDGLSGEVTSQGAIKGALYEGTSSSGGVYQVKAERAAPTSLAMDIIELEGLSVQLQMQPEVTRFVSPSGLFNGTEQTLALLAPVQLERSDGFSMLAGDTTVDLGTNKIGSEQAIVIRLGEQKLSASGFKFDLDNKKLELIGNVVADIPARGRAQ